MSVHIDNSEEYVVMINEEEFERRDSYRFFKKFEKSYYGIGTRICIDSLIAYKKKYNASFYGLITFVIIKACNQVKHFRYRLQDNKICLYDKVACSCAVLKEDKNIEFTNFILESNSLKNFLSEFEKKRKLALCENKYCEKTLKAAALYLTAMPWFPIKYMDNARYRLRDDTIPRFTYGKYYVNDEHIFLDLSIEMSHMFVDGYHVHLLLEEIDKIINNLEML